MMIVSDYSYSYHIIVTKFSLIAVFFGFEQEEYVYNELTDEGLQDIPFSAAPGNVTEKSLTFTLYLIAVERAFVFGRKSWLYYLSLVLNCFFFITATGDLSFGPNILSPNIRFDDMIIAFSVINDNIVEGREVGSISIAASTSYDVASPRFRTIRIVVNDDDGNTIIFNK